MFVNLIDRCSELTLMIMMTDFMALLHLCSCHTALIWFSSDSEGRASSTYQRVSGLTHDLPSACWSVPSVYERVWIWVFWGQCFFSPVRINTAILNMLTALCFNRFKPTLTRSAPPLLGATCGDTDDLWCCQDAEKSPSDWWLDTGSL